MKLGSATCPGSIGTHLPSASQVQSPTQLPPASVTASAATPHAAQDGASRAPQKMGSSIARHALE